MNNIRLFINSLRFRVPARRRRSQFATLPVWQTVTVELLERRLNLSASAIPIVELQLALQEWSDDSFYSGSLPSPEALGDVHSFDLSDSFYQSGLLFNANEAAKPGDPFVFDFILADSDLPSLQFGETLFWGTQEYPIDLSDAEGFYSQAFGHQPPFFESGYFAEDLGFIDISSLFGLSSTVTSAQDLSDTLIEDATAEFENQQALIEHQFDQQAQQFWSNNAQETLADVFFETDAHDTTEADDTVTFGEPESDDSVFHEPDNALPDFEEPSPSGDDSDFDVGPSFRLLASDHGDPDQLEGDSNHFVQQIIEEIERSLGDQFEVTATQVTSEPFGGGAQLAITPQEQTEETPTESPTSGFDEEIITNGDLATSTIGLSADAPGDSNVIQDSPVLSEIAPGQFSVDVSDVLRKSAANTIAFVGATFFSSAAEEANSRSEQLSAGGYSVEIANEARAFVESIYGDTQPDFAGQLSLSVSPDSLSSADLEMPVRYFSELGRESLRIANLDTPSHTKMFGRKIDYADNVRLATVSGNTFWVVIVTAAGVSARSVCLTRRRRELADLRTRAI